MENLPSKELLSAVLGFGVRSFDINPNKTLISYVKDNASVSNFTSINIYELMHKCKEWAMQNGWHINSKVYEDGGIAGLTDNEGSMELLSCIERFPADSEPEAVLKATQWIYDKLQEYKDGNFK